nr:M20 family metallopeptidase [uncultured Olsenella sp.]
MTRDVMVGEDKGDLLAQVAGAGPYADADANAGMDKDTDRGTNAVVGLTQALVRIDSSDPGAFEGEVAGFVRGWLESRIGRARELADEGGREALGHVFLEELEALPGRPCLRAVIPAAGEHDATGMGVTGLSPDDEATTEGLPGLVYCCHQDTVVLGDGWDDETPALGARVLDGRLYGRGSCDMKGGLACAMLAFGSALDEVALRGRLPRRRMTLLCTVDEEDFMRGIEAAIATGWVGSTDWVLDTEPTGGKARMAHKGRSWFELELRGVTAHASTPWRGVDAVAAAAEAVVRIRSAVAALERHPDLGTSTVTFGQIEGGYRPYVVPDDCHVWIDMRLVPPAGTDSASGIVTDALRAAERAVPGCVGSYEVTGDRPPIEANPQSGLLALLQEASAEVTGAKAGIDVFTGYTDGAVVAGTCGNRDCVSYGPGELEMAHKPNEYVPLADLERVRAVLCELARRALW